MRQGIKWTLAAIIGLWIRLPIAVQALVVLMLIDYVTGVLSAALAGELSSEKGWKGLVRKILALLMVLASYHLMKPIAPGFDIVSIVATALSMNEGLSITENCARSGVPIPKRIADLLSFFRGTK